MDFQNLITNLQFSNIAWEIVTPLIFSLCDVISGYIQAVINKDVDSKKMREGLLHKTLITMILVLGFVVRCAFNLKFVSGFISVYIILMEGVSILENITKCGLDLGKLGTMLKEKAEENLQEKEDKEGE